MNSNEYAIQVQHIGKRYRIGVKEEIHDSIGGTILNYITSPIRNYRKYRALYKFKDDELEKPDTGKNSDILWALKDISFEVKQGEVLGIIGKNGAGKSTLLKILCGITDPSKGYGEIHGRVSSLLEVGTGFHPDLTGRENVYLNATILGMKKVEVDRRYDEIVEFSGVEKFIDTPVKRYSSGMTVRLAFSVAAHLEPEILLIDEVLAVGDAEFQRKCLNKMENVGEKGRTVLFVSHNMSAITRLCKRTILIDNGVVIADGPSQEVVKSYLTSGSGSTALQEWHDPEKSPHGDVVRLLAVSVRGKNGEITEAVDIRDRFCIRMDYEVLKPGHRLMPFHHLYNDEGVEIFGAHDSDPAWNDLPRSAGRYKSIAWIPGNLLSEGTLFVNSGMMTLSPDTRQFYETATVAFQIIERDGGSPARGGWAGPMSGAVRPLLEWETESIP